jgi:hypothetical protein
VLSLAVLGPRTTVLALKNMQIHRVIIIAHWLTLYRVFLLFLQSFAFTCEATREQRFYMSFLNMPKCSALLWLCPDRRLSLFKWYVVPLPRQWVPSRPEIILVSPQGLGQSRQEVWRHPNLVELKQTNAVQDITRYVSDYPRIQHACADRGKKRARTGSLELRSFGSWQSPIWLKNSPPFIRPESPSQRCKSACNKSLCWTKSVQSHFASCFVKMCFNVILTCASVSSDWPLPCSRDWCLWTWWRNVWMPYERGISWRSLQLSAALGKSYIVE